MPYMIQNWLTSQPIAHRGLHNGAVAENSLAAFEAAAQAGYAIELDVRVSADRQLVVIHDPTTGRVLPFDKEVGRTAAAELAPLPLLAEVLATVQGRVPILIEIKNGPLSLAAGPLVMAALKTYSGEVAVASFDPRIVNWFRRHAPHIPRGQLVSRLPETAQPQLLKWLLRTMVSNWVTRPDFVAYDVRDLPSRNLAWWRRQRQMPVVLWSIDTPERLKQAQDYRANVIFEKVRPPF